MTACELALSMVHLKVGQLLVQTAVVRDKHVFKTPVKANWGLVVPGMFDVFSVFIFRQFFLDFPYELEEAARVDGLGTFGTYWRIVVPNSKGVFISLGTLGLIRSWNSFLWPLVIGQSRDTWTVQVVLSTFLTAQTINLPALFMGAAVGIIPIQAVFFIVQRYIVEGVRVSGIK